MAYIYMRFPEGKKRALTLSYDDGVEQDIRLIEIMKKYGLKGTFNLNSGLYAPEGTVYPKGTIHRRMTKKQVTELYKDSGMEVAVHGFTHPFLQRLPDNLCTNDIIKDREGLEEQFDTIVRGMAYPFGTYNDDVIECARRAGIVYSRTTISTGGYGIPRDWLQWNTTCHHDDARLMEHAHNFIERNCTEDGWLFYLWGHSYEFEEHDNWHVMEEFAEYMGGREDIWYATNMEIYDYVEAYRKLVYSMDGHKVFNPTLLPLWFEKDGVLYCVAPGECAAI